MRRLLIALGALALFAAAILAGIALSARFAPDRVRGALEELLAAELGPVSIGEVRPFFAWGVGIEIADLRGDSLSADRVWITLSPRSLLRGAPRVRRVDARGVAIAATEDAGGRWSPAWIERARDARATRDEGAGASRGIRDMASALPALSVEDAALRATRADGASIALRLHHLSLAHDPLGGPPELRAAGRVDRLGLTTPDGDDPPDLGGFELHATLGDPAPHGSLAFTNLALSALPAERLAPLRAAGRVSGVATWTPAASGAGALELDLVGIDVRFARGEDAAVAFPTAQLRASAAIDASRIAIGELAWRSESLRLAGAGSLARPIDDDAALAFELSGGPLAIETLRDLARLATEPRSAERRNLDALRAGRVETLSLRLDATPLGRLRARAGAPAKPSALTAWTEGLALELAIDGVELRADGGDPIRELSGRLHLEGERLRIENARAKLGDRPLPGLELEVSGLGAALAAIEAGAPPPAVPPLPGRIALDRWIDSLRRPGSPPRWRRIDVRADWIEHPVLLRALEQVTAVLMPANPGVHIREAKGFWGGVSFRGSGSFYGGAKSRIEATLALDPARRSGRRRGNAEAWGRARFHADLEKLGDFQAESLEGVLVANGDRLLLRRGEARLRPRGDLAGSVDVDLSLAERVPYRMKVELSGGSLSDMMNDLKLDGGAARGTAALDAELAGFVQAGHKPLADMSGTAMLRLRDGEIHKRMNLLFAIAQASDTLNPFRSRETIPYEEVDAPIDLASGIARTEGFSLQGPALRMVGTGQVDLVTPPNHVEAVIGIFFFRTLDRVIGIFPLLNRMLLGPDDNLVSTYFAVSGPWANPAGTLIPTKSIASGPASFVLEGLPAFVRGGLSTIERVLTGDAARTPSNRQRSQPAEPPRASGGPS